MNLGAPGPAFGTGETTNLRGQSTKLQLQIGDSGREYQWPFGLPAGMKIGLYMTFNGAGGFNPLKEVEFAVPLGPGLRTHKTLPLDKIHHALL